VNAVPVSSDGAEAGAAQGHVLVIRAWQDDGDVRARLLDSGELDDLRSLAVAQGPDGICEMVRSWLLGISLPGVPGN
jgi:hypothetical protein